MFSFCLLSPTIGQEESLSKKSTQVKVLPLPDQQTAILFQGKEVLRWHFDSKYPRPFFFPFLSERGTRLTRMGHPGAPNHDHHRSIWFAHHKVSGINFWADNGKGKVRQKQWLAYQDGNDEAVMAFSLGWFIGEHQELLDQEVIAAWRPGSGNGYELELQITFNSKLGEVVLQKTNFGFLGIRMAKELSGYFGNGKLRNSEGGRGEKQIFGKQAKWVDYSGPTENLPEGIEGITYFDHPSNPNYPSHWHVREDGWMGASFCFSGDYKLEKGKPLVLRYLLFAHSGKASESLKKIKKVGIDFEKRDGFRLVKSRKPHTQFEVNRVKKVSNKDK